MSKRLTDDVRLGGELAVADANRGDPVREAEQITPTIRLERGHPQMESASVELDHEAMLREPEVDAPATPPQPLERGLAFRRREVTTAKEPQEHRLELRFGRRLGIEFTEDPAGPGDPRTTPSRQLAEHRLDPRHGRPARHHLILDASLQRDRRDDLAEIDEGPLDRGDPQASAATDVVIQQRRLMDADAVETVTPVVRYRHLEHDIIETHPVDAGRRSEGQHTGRHRDERRLGEEFERVRRRCRREDALVETTPAAGAHLPSSAGRVDTDGVEERLGEYASTGSSVMSNTGGVHGGRLLASDRREGKTNDGRDDP